MNWFQRLLRLDGAKDIEAWRGGQVSTEHADNFVTNQVTVADYRDLRLQNGGGIVGLSATWACVNLIAGTIGSLPLMVYRTDSKGVRTVAKDHPLYFVLHDSPNFDQSAVDFWEFMAASIDLHGNAYATIERRSGGVINALVPIRPDLVKVRRTPTGDLEYSWTEDGLRIVKRGVDVLHIRGPFGDALSGASTLSICGSVFDDALSAESAAGAMFRNGVNPSGILSTPPEVKLTKEQRKELEEHLALKYMGSIRQGRPMLLDGGLSWNQLTINPADAQMLESRKFSGEQICRLFGVPPAMVGFGDKSSNWGTGKEEDVLGFQKFTLRKRLKRIEQAVLKQLVPLAERRAQGITIEFNFEGLQAKAQAAAAKPAAPKAVPGAISLENYKVPGAKEGGGGGSGGSSKEKLNAYERELIQIDKRTKALQLEAEMVGKSTFEREKARASLELETAAKKANIPITDEMRRKIEESATGYANAKVKVDEVRKALDAAQDAQKFFGDAITDSLSDMIFNGAKAQDVMKKLAVEIGKAALQAALMGSGPLAGIFGTAGAGGNAGGLIGGLLGGLKLAGGGFVSGRGTSKSDSIPARLSNGEYVINARATKQNRALLDAINSGKLPRFADGGPVGNVAADTMEVWK